MIFYHIVYVAVDWVIRCEKWNVKKVIHNDRVSKLLNFGNEKLEIFTKFRMRLLD
jgi:hypothetical protein